MCTSVMAGKKATFDETILLSRNEDYTRNNWNKYMVFRPFPEYFNEQGGNTTVADGIWTLENGLKVTVPKKMYRYNAMPDAAGDEEASYTIRRHFFYEERGINERNVAISATNSLSINQKASEVDPLLLNGGIAESVIPTLLLPQVESAKDAVKLLGKYVEEHGANEVNGILIGDPDESWYFEIGSCHHWIAVKIPEDSYLIIANGMRVHSVDLSNDDVLHSKHLFEFVRDYKLLDTPDRHDFNFAEAFGIPGDPYNVDRIWLAQQILTPSLKQKPREYQYPLFLKPDKKIHVRDVMNVLRATYQGTVLEGIAERPIGVDRTAESHIMVLDSKMPQELKGLIWQVISTPMGAPYIPLYSVMDDIPPGFSIEGNLYSPLSAYWSFRGLYALCEINHDEYKPLVEGLWRHHEEQSLLENEPMKEMLIKMYSHNPTTAIDFAKRYSTGIAWQSVGIANKERNLLMTKITNDTMEK